MDRSHAVSLDKMGQTFCDAGFNMTGEVTGLMSVWKPEEVEFCRGRLVEVHEGEYHLVRSIPRALATIGVTHRYPPGQDARYEQVLKGAALCELSVSANVPCISYLAAAIVRELGEVTAKYDDDDLYKYSVRFGLSTPSFVDNCVSVDDCCRVSVERAFGVTVAQQLDYERKVSAIVKSIRRKYTYTSDACERTWLNPEDEVCVV